jgi:shikimate dehydrogenase
VSANRVVLIGDPVGHSVSPAMHRACFRALGLDLDYVAIRVAPEELPEAFAELRVSTLGLNVTRPLKERIGELLDEISPAAEAAGSVNTVSFAAGRSAGDSTDGPGALAALKRAGHPIGGTRALVLGTGGAARAVAVSLRNAGAEVTVWGRDADAAARLAGDLRVASGRLSGALSGSNLVVNATPVGAWPDGDSSPIPADVRLPRGATVFDLVYRPRRTLLLRRAESEGCRTVPGIEMLIEQGLRSFAIWTGREAPASVMRTSAYQALLGPAEPDLQEVG